MLKIKQKLGDLMSHVLLRMGYVTVGTSAAAAKVVIDKAKSAHSAEIRALVQSHSADRARLKRLEEYTDELSEIVYSVNAERFLFEQRHSAWADLMPKVLPYYQVVTDIDCLEIRTIRFRIPDYTIALTHDPRLADSLAPDAHAALEHQFREHFMRDFVPDLYAKTKALVWAD